MLKTLRSYAVMALGAFLTLFGFNAHADVPAAVTAGITSAVSDVGSIGALVMGVIVAIVAFVWLKRVLSGK